MRKILLLILTLFTFTSLIACNTDKPDDKNDNENKLIDVSMVTFTSKEFIYDGNVHKIECENVPAGVTPLYIGNGQSNVGTYQVTARLIQDSTRTLLKELVATITIKPASGQNPDDGNGDGDDEQPIDVSMVVFADDKVEYDGNAHSLTATNVPTGVTPQYEGNNKVEVGIYTVTCKLYDANNRLLATLHATLEIIEKEVETDPNDVSKVIFANKTVTYNGESHSITALNVPSTVRAEYEGNDKVEVGTYTITCKLYSTEGQLLATLTATLKINDPVDVQLPLV